MHDGPALLGLDEDGHDPDVVLIMEVGRNVLLRVHHHIWICIQQVIVHLIKLPCKTDDKEIVENVHRHRNYISG